MKTVLVTGCSGYIGSHLCKLLVDNNYNVHGLDVVEPKVQLNKFYKVDINQLFTIPGQLDPYDAVIHLAALVSVNESVQKPIIYYITNTNGTMNVINKIPTKHFIFASTGCASDPTNPYGLSKRMAEYTVQEYCTVHNPINYTIFRFFNVTGTAGYPPTNPDGLFYNLLNSAKTGEFTIFGNDYNTIDGTCLRDYVHVMEICHSIMNSIDNPSNSIESLGHGIGISVKEMFDRFVTTNNLNIKLNYGPRRNGDVAESVLKDVSKYMVNLYSLDDLLRAK
jgi:UDP-glucose 4-epimerase